MHTFRLPTVYSHNAVWPACRYYIYWPRSCMHNPDSYSRIICGVSWLFFRWWPVWIVEDKFGNCILNITKTNCVPIHVKVHLCNYTNDDNIHAKNCFILYYIWFWMLSFLPKVMKNMIFWSHISLSVHQELLHMADPVDLVQNYFLDALVHLRSRTIALETL